MGENFTRSLEFPPSTTRCEVERAEFEVFGHIAPLACGKSDAELSQLADRLELFSVADGLAIVAGSSDELP